jgi:hypothetical protein
MAARMAALGMTGRPLLTLHARHLAGELDAFQPVSLSAVRDSLPPAPAS